MKYRSPIIFGVVLFSSFLHEGLAQSGWIQTSLPEQVRTLCFIDTLTGWASNNVYVKKTTNGGINWYDANAGFTFFFDKNIGFAPSGGGFIIKTTNGGNSIASKQANLNTGHPIRFYFYNSNLGFASSYDRIARTTDLGETWTTQSLDGGEIQDIGFSDSLNGCAVGNGINGAGYRWLKTTDGGVTWKAYTNTPTQYISRIQYLSPSKVVIVGDGIFISTNSGITWSKKVSNMYFTELSFSDPLNGWAAGHTNIVHTTDGGVSWSKQNTPSGIYFLSLFAIDSLHAWAGSLRTIDGGGTASNLKVPVPTLTEPANNTMFSQSNLNLKWSKVDIATNYRVQVATDPLFVSIFVDDSSLNAIQKPISSLKDSTNYYWRVSAVQNGNASDWSSVWMFSTVGTTPQLSLPQNGSMNLPNGIQFQWNPSFRAVSYRLQISKDSMFQNLAADDSNITATTKLLTQLTDSTKYFWHIRSLTDLGEVFWSPIWSFSTASELFYTPKPVSPQNGAMDLPIFLGFTWTSVPGDIRYRLQVATDSLFTAIVIDADQSYLYDHRNGIGPFKANSTYYWRIASIENIGGKIRWSSYSKFSTMIRQMLNLPFAKGNKWYYQFNASSQTPEYYKLFGVIKEIIDTAADGIYVIRTKNIYRDSINLGTEFWINRDGMLYKTNNPATIGRPIYVGGLTKDSSFEYNYYTYKLFQSTLFGTTYNAQGLYYSQMISHSASSSTIKTVENLGIIYEDTYFAGGGVSYSRSWTLTGVNILGSVIGDTIIKIPPKSPLLNLPMNNSSSMPLSNTLSWDSVGGATKYRLQVSTDAYFYNTIILDDSTLTSNQRMVGPLSDSTLYYWRVLASNADLKGNWSATWQFRTRRDFPRLLSPGINTQSILPPVTFFWTPVTNGISYRLQISTDSMFQVKIFDDSLLTVNQKQLNILHDSVLYFWHVSALNNDQIVSWSERWKFRTAGIVPTLTIPFWGQVLSFSPIYLQWEPVARATSYRLQIALDPQFQVPVYDNSSLSSTSQLIDSLTNNTTYYWRVCGIVNNSQMIWSAVSYFIAAGYSTPNLISPINGSQELIPPITFNWGIVPNQYSYQLQIARDSMFHDIIFNEGNIFANTKQVSVPIDVPIYYWHVRTSSFWSPHYSFTVPLLTPSLTQPTNGSLHLEVPISFKWDPTSNAISYRLQIAKDSLFQFKIVDDSTITVTSKQVDYLPNSSQYFWRVGSKTASGEIYWSSKKMFTKVTEWTNPGSYQMLQNYPNPFNNTTNFIFRTIGNGNVTLKIFNTLGREVGTVISESLPPKEYSIPWEAKNLPSGIYFYRLQAGAFTETKKLILIK